MATEGFICPSEFQPYTANWMSLCNEPLGPWFVNLVWAAIGAIAGFLWHRLRNWRTQKDRLSADHRDYQARKERLQNLRKSLDHEPEGSRSPQLAVVSGLIPEEHTIKLKDILLKNASKFEGNDQCHVLEGPKVVQWTVPLGDDIDILDKLNDLAVAGTSVDRSFNLQLDRLRIFHLTDEGVKNSNLEDHSHQVPVILHASYAAGCLTIEGLHLRGAVITASTSTRSAALKTKFRKGPSQMEIHRCFIKLPSSQVDEAFVYATKKIDLEGHRDVSVRSLAVPIQQDNLRAVLRLGLPSTMLVIYAVKQLWMKFGVHEFAKKPEMNHALVACLPPVIVFLTQILPQSTEEKVKNWFKRGCFVVSTFCFATRKFLSEQDECAQKLKSSRSKKKVANLRDLGSTKMIKENCEHNIELDVEKFEQKRSIRSPSLPRYPPVPSHRRKPTRDHDDYGYESETDSNETMPTLETMSTWEWPAYDAVYDQYGQVTLTRRSTPGLKDKYRAPFDVVYQHRKGMPWAEGVRVTIYSSMLAKVLTEFLPGEIQSVSANKKTRIWVKDLFHVREALKEKGREFAAGASRGDTNMTEPHLLLGVLLRFMEKEFEETEESYSAMVKQQRASWDMLWAFFPPGEKVVYQCGISDEEVCGFVNSTEYQFKLQCDQWDLVVNLTAWDYNGQTWRKHSTQRLITLYQGDRGFTDLRAIRPLRYTEDPAGAEKAFLQRGEMFCWLSMLAKKRYMDYKGPIFVMKGRGPFRQLVKEKANGRVMVDLESFARMNPGYDMGSATPPTDVFRDRKVESVDIKAIPDRMYAPALVYGFSFRLKKWGSFSIMGFDHITFNDAAFDALVMDPVRKELLYRLVSEYIKDSRSNNSNDGQIISTGRVDPIANKGEGCISLCYGPPGTGKTLTAESIAEKLHCPLWSLSVSELGTDPETLESTLVKVLEIAASWGAVLLLDEADVYLERRNSSSLKRNAMTGIFLRELEYYRGVLFLTTNRVVMFDEAFCSRISMFLHYEKHNRETRATIWKTLLQRLKPQIDMMGENPGDYIEDLSVEFSEAEFNGREIRNVIQTAVTLAKSKDENLNGNHLRQSWTSLTISLEELKFTQSPLDKGISKEREE